jgi:hypothetical protein
VGTPAALLWVAIGPCIDIVKSFFVVSNINKASFALF